ncbi:MAG: hypothetical protein HY040_14200 [Planctomycetes bacterium]|nr:hypothetical protein [Planctomycetota bacterium]
MDLIDFYLERAPDDRGRWLHEIWAWDFEALEDVHDYIQELFPLRERSRFQPTAPILDDRIAGEFRTNPMIRANLRKSFDRMLNFYGFRWDEAWTRIVPAEHFRERSNNWLFPEDHNHLRITRILKSLTLCGLEAEAREFLEALLAAVDEQSVTWETLQFWREAVS